MEKGLLEVTNYGTGYIKSENEEFYVSKDNCLNYMTGDIVSYLRKGKIKNNKEEVFIKKLLNRNDFFAVLVEKENKIFIKRGNVNIEFLKTEVKEDYLNSYVKIGYDLNKSQYFIKEKLGDLSKEKIENEIAIQEHSIPFEFSEKVLNETQNIYNNISEEKNNREDYTNLCFITIDGESSKDFDDAVYCEKTEFGYSLYVAIADVGHYVEVNSFLDKEALNRGNSVYFSNEVIPMLPERLSNDLCSLNEKEDKLVLVCKINFNTKGKLTSYKFSEGVINSKKRCTYNEVFDILNNKKKIDKDIEDNIFNLQEVYFLLNEKREKRGALNFETKEAKVIFDDNYKIENIVIEERNIAHKIIEECMLIANVCASKLLLKYEINSLYRNHPKPNQEKIEELRDFLKSFGLDFRKSGKEISTIHFNILLKNIEKSEHKDILSKNILKTMSKAVYEIENVGHFGLGYENYTHFTSPIRRYSDLVIHRNIKMLIQGDNNFSEIISSKTKQNKDLIQYNINELLVISEQINNSEKRANKATKEAYESLACFYLKNKTNLNGVKGKITHFTNNFMYVELLDYLIEGVVYYRDLKGYYEYKREKEELVSNNNKYSIADVVSVKIKDIDYNNKKIILKIS